MRRVFTVVSAVVLAMALAIPVFAADSPNDAIKQNIERNGAFVQVGGAVTNGQVCFRAGPDKAILTPGNGGANADGTVVTEPGPATPCGSGEITQRVAAPGLGG